MRGDGPNDRTEPGETAQASGESEGAASPITSDRRRFLKAASAVVGTAPLAGCPIGGSSSGNETVTKTPTIRSATAGDAGLEAQAVQDVGYPNVQAQTEQRTVRTQTSSKRIGYALDETEFRADNVGFPAKILATPSLTVNGSERNPTIADPLSDLVSDGRHYDTSWLDSTGLVGSSVEYKSTPSSVSTSSSGNGYDAGSNTLLGGSVSYEVYESVVGPSGSSDRSDWTTVHVALARTTHDGDGVVVGAATGVPADTGTVPDARLAYIIETLLPAVNRSPASSYPQVDTSLDDARLVQTVSETTVRNRSPAYRVDDPELVLDEFVAPLFSVDGSTHPGRAYIDVSASGHSDQFQLPRGDISGSGTDLAGIADTFDTNRRNVSNRNPSPFRLRQGTGSVSISAEAPCGQELSSTTIPKGGSGYETTDIDPLRVGFIACDGPTTFGQSYGTTSQYQRTVELTLEYADHVFPGDVYGYRYDRTFTGSLNATGPFGGASYVQFGTDCFNAKTLLNAARLSSQTGGNGQFYGFGGSRGDAQLAIQNNGFNAWVLIVPDGYYSYHGIGPAAGLAPFSIPVANTSKRINLMAVSVQDRAARPNDRATAQTAIHELGHFFGGGNLYDVGPQDRPLAQRDDRGSTTRINGDPVDFAHARHLNSTLDNDGNPDNPGVASLGFDFAGGQFRFVTSYTINPRSGGGLSVRSSGPFGPPDGIESYMSYADTNDQESVWADAHVHQRLLDIEWNQRAALASSGVVFSAAGRPETDRETEGEGGTESGDISVQFESTRVYDGIPQPDDIEGEGAQVTMRAPDGEALATRTVPESLDLDHAEESLRYVPVEAPFPERAVSVEIEGSTVSTQLNPLVRPLRDAVERVPDRGLADPPSESRDRLLEPLLRVESAMAEQQYGAAAEAVNRFAELVPETVLESYEPNADQPNRNALAALAERMVTRLQGLAGN